MLPPLCSSDIIVEDLEEFNVFLSPDISYVQINNIEHLNYPWPECIKPGFGWT